MKNIVLFCFVLLLGSCAVVDSSNFKYLDDENLELHRLHIIGAEHDIEHIRKLLVRTGGIQSVIEETIKFRDRAFEILNTFTDNPSKSKLIKLVEMINFDTINQ